jgi:lipopolysaccharide export system permease protein
MWGILDRYIARSVLGSIGTVLLLVVALSSIIKFVEQLRRVGSGDYTSLSAGIFTLLTVPQDTTIFFPMAALLGSLVGLGGLASKSELVAMQAAGFSRLQVAGSVLKIGLPLMLFSLVISEWVVPPADNMARSYRAQKLYGANVLSAKYSVWAKDGSNFIFINRIVNNTELMGVNIYQFDEDGKLARIKYAQTARYDREKKHWYLSQLNESDLTDRLRITSKQSLFSVWESTLTPDKLGAVAADPDSLSIRGLRDYIGYLDQSGVDSVQYRFVMWSKVFSPLSIAVMMLIALSFVFGPLRSVSLGMKIISGISFGFLFYIAERIIGRSSIVFGLDPLLAAVIPSALCLLLALYLLSRPR